MKYPSKLGIISLVCDYICGKPRIYTALAVKNIKVNFVFLARLSLYLRLSRVCVPAVEWLSNNVVS